MKLIVLLSLSLNFHTLGNVSDTFYYDLMNKFEARFTPLLKDQCQLTIYRQWDDTSLGIFVQKDKVKCYAAISGAVAKYPLVTEDGLTSVMCHIMGRFLGGWPKKYIGSQASWSSNMGQSDYYANLKCLRMIWEKDDNIEIMKTRDVDKFAKQKCDQSFKDPQTTALCQRTSMTALGLTLAYHQVNLDNNPDSNEAKPQFTTPDLKQVRQTTDEKPSPQCRLDTMFAASLCPVDVDEPLSDDHPGPGTCTKKAGFTMGLRPRCWYNGD